MRTRHNDERGMALIMVMLLTVAVAALVAGAIFLTSSSTLISKGQEREEEMRNAADAGIELGRSKLNGGTLTMPTTGYNTLFVNQAVYDANNVLIPGVTRSVYYGPTSSTTGQYGIFGSVVSVITDASGAVVVRRGELNQESFAKFGYFSASEGSGICFGNNDNIFGPLHSNDNMCIYSSLARFRNTVEVAGTITGVAYGTFDRGYTTGSASIPLPTIAQLSTLATQAAIGNMSFTAPSPAPAATGQARMRVEFMAIDLDGDGKVTGPNEGFYRIYNDSGATAQGWYIVASRIDHPDTMSRNCGHFHAGNAMEPGGVFYTAVQHYRGWGSVTFPTPHTPVGHSGSAPYPAAATKRASAQESLTSTTTGAYRCWLGGDEHLFVDSTASPAGGTKYVHNTFVAADSFGNWVKYTTTPDPAVIAGLANPASGIVDTTLANRTLLAQYLWPLSRTYNPSSKGVMYFTGRVAVSGTLNGRMTVAASDKVLIVNDLRYAIAPGSAPCLAANILGLLSADSILVADNTLNAPWDYTAGSALDPSSTARNYKTSNDETIQGVMLTLKSFGAEHYGNGGTSEQPCQTSTTGRGCLSLTGGIIQGTRGAVGTTSGTGYVKRYSYDVCAFQTPPPYFPTTGRYDRNRYYEIDPVGFTVAAFFNSLTP